MISNRAISFVVSILFLSLISVVSTPATSFAANFTVSSLPNSRTMILSDGNGNTITVSSTETNTTCFNISAAGRVTMFANSGACNRAIPLNFATSGFAMGQVNFADIDDMDGSSSRDAFAANVSGTWTSPQLDVNPLVGPLPSWLSSTQDQRSRLISAGGIGSFLARASGNNPVDDSATFTLDTPTTSFTIYMDDVEGARSAQMFFDLAPLTVDIPATLTLNKTVVNDSGGTETASAWTLTASGPSTLSGSSGVNGTVLPGTYALSESGPADYTLSELTCVGAADTDPSDGLTLADSEVVTCTFTNDDNILAPAILIAVDDTPTAQNGALGGTTPESVLDNDTLNGVAVVPADVTLTPGTAPSPAAGSIAMNADGTLTVAAGTTAGTYSFPYTICEALNPANCDTATATVIVDVSPLDEIREELSSILEEDLAATISNQSRSFSALSGEALDRLIDSRGTQCAPAIRGILKENDLNFATASAVILPESEPVLDEILEALSTCPQSRFEIAGHTDSRGSDAYNIALSQARVNSVKIALVNRGVRSDRLVGVGYGERRPIADNGTAAGRAANRRVEFVAIDGLNGSVSQSQRCGTVEAFDVDGGFEFGENGLNTAGTFGGETFDCNTSERRITRGEFRVTENDDLGTQGMLSFTIARERQIGFDRLNGRFWGGYLSRTDVQGDADGYINGVGVNAGFYGARAHEIGFYSNFYAAGSFGVHTFDLAFDPATTAEGSYLYAGLFAGVGLTGVIERDSIEVRPKIGFDIGAGVASDADVTASGLGATQSGTVQIDPVIGFRGYVETSFITSFADREGDDLEQSDELVVTPRLFCDSDFDGSDTECGLGGRINFSRYDPTRNVDWQLGLDAEVTDQERSISIGIGREREVLNGLGTISTKLSGNEAGEAEVSHFLNLRW